MSGIFESMHLALSSAARSRGARGIAIALIVPIVLMVLLIWALAPAVGGSGAVPVAVVNLDEGATTESGGRVHKGDDLVESLGDTTELLWSEVDEEAADAGLEDGTYALAIKIPADYSSCIASLSGSSPRKATVEVVSSGGQNVLATSAGSAALKQLQARLRSEVGEQYLVSVLTDVQQQATSLTLTSDGSTMLESGYDAMIEGADAIAAGLDETASGTDQLGSGLGQIAEGAVATSAGAEALGQGIAAIRDQAAAPLAQGAEALASGLDTVSETAGAMGSGVEQVGEALDGVADTLSQNMEDIAALGTSAGQIVQQGASLSTALEGVTAPLASATEAAGTVAAGAAGASEAVGAVRDQAAALAGELSSDDEQAPGVAQQLAALDARDAELTSQLREVALDAELAAEDRAARVEELDGQIAQIDVERQQLQERIASGAATAAQLSESAAGASDALASAVEANDELAAASGELAGAATGVSDPVQGLVEATTSAATSAGSIARGVATAQATLAGVGEPGSDGYVAGLADTTVSLGQGISALAGQLSSTGAVGSGVTALSTGASALGQALTPLAEATDQLAAGNATLATALDGVVEGASGLSAGLSAMSDATGQLGEGAEQLKDASSQIGESVADAGEELGGIAGDREERAEVASSAVTFKTSRAQPVGEATSVAPAIVASALWLAAMLAACVLPELDVRAIAAGRIGAAMLAPVAGAVAFGLVQGVVALVCLAMAGVEMRSAAATAALVIGASVAFACIARALASWCGRAFVPASVALLAVQIACAGGIVPDSLSFGVPRALGRILPVPVLADALRGTFAGIASRAVLALPVLFAFIVIALAATALRAHASRTLHPHRLPA